MLEIDHADARSVITGDALTLLAATYTHYLDEIDSLANQWADWSDDEVMTIRELVGDFVFLTRRLLRDHAYTEASVCGVCLTEWPCRAIALIHSLLIGFGSSCQPGLTRRWDGIPSP